MSTPYGVEGCICWADQDGDGWYPNAACPYHGVLADFTPDRRDTGTYIVHRGADGKPTELEPVVALPDVKTGSYQVFSNEAVEDVTPVPCERHPGASTIAGLCAMCVVTPDGPECPPGYHSIFDPCPGGCLNDDEPDPDPADGCGYHQEGQDCEYHGPLPLHIITTEQEQDDRPGVLAAIRRWVARLVYGRAHDVDGW